MRTSPAVLLRLPKNHVAGERFSSAVNRRGPDTRGKRAPFARARIRLRSVGAAPCVLRVIHTVQVYRVYDNIAIIINKVRNDQNTILITIQINSSPTGQYCITCAHVYARYRIAGNMCLWKVLLLGWNRTGPDSDAASGKDPRRRRPSDDDDDDLSDSGISSGEFSLENVCEDACGPVTPRPPSPTSSDRGNHDRNNRYNILLYYIYVCMLCGVRRYSPDTHRDM